MKSILKYLKHNTLLYISYNLLICLLFLTSGCILWLADGDTDSGGGTDTEGIIPIGYKTYYISQTRSYHSAAFVGCSQNTKPITYPDYTNLLEATLKKNHQPENEAWQGVYHCDKLADSTDCVWSTAERWRDVDATIPGTDSAFADNATLVVFSGISDYIQESLYFLMSDSNNKCRVAPFSSNDEPLIVLNSTLQGGGIGQGANGLMLLTGCSLAYKQWGQNGTGVDYTWSYNHNNRFYGFGSKTLALSEDQVSQWWDNLIEGSPNYGYHDKEGWAHWLSSMEDVGAGPGFFNTPIIITRKFESENYSEFQDRHSFGNIRSGTDLMMNLSKDPDESIVDIMLVGELGTTCTP